jgi:hypothetical protein
MQGLRSPTWLLLCALVASVHGANNPLSNTHSTASAANPSNPSNSNQNPSSTLHTGPTLSTSLSIGLSLSGPNNILVTVTAPIVVTLGSISTTPTSFTPTNLPVAATDIPGGGDSDGLAPSPGASIGKTPMGPPDGYIAGARVQTAVAGFVLAACIFIGIRGVIG